MDFPSHGISTGPAGAESEINDFYEDCQLPTSLMAVIFLSVTASIGFENFRTLAVIAIQREYIISSLFHHIDY